MYTDNTSLTYSSQNPDELSQALTQDLAVLKIWLDANRLSLNVIKTKCMFTGTRQKVSVLPSVPDIRIVGHKIERVSSYKFLDVHVDESLSWATHISEISIKVAKALGALRRLKPICPHQILVSIYKSLILPNFDYCSVSLGMRWLWPNSKTTKTTKQGSTNYNWF